MGQIDGFQDFEFEHKIYISYLEHGNFVRGLNQPNIDLKYCQEGTFQFCNR